MLREKEKRSREGLVKMRKVGLQKDRKEARWREVMKCLSEQR